MEEYSESFKSSARKGHVFKKGLVSKKTFERFGMGLILVLSAIPVGNILHILLTTGAGNLSNDYAMFIPTIDKILSGNYLWSNFFRDSFYGSHFQVIPMLIYLGSAIFTSWNVYFDLAIVWFMSIIRIFLTYQILTNRNSTRNRFVLLLVISALIFSTSQISDYEFGSAGALFEISVFGFTLGLWGLFKYTHKPRGIVIMLVGGVVASWTAATGIMAWVIFLIALFLLGYKKIIHYFVWLISSFVVNFPYLYFLVIDRKPGVNAVWQSLFNLRLIVNLLGRPLANGIGSTTAFLQSGELAGWLGLIMGVLGLALLIIKIKQVITTAFPAILLMAYGILAAWQISIFRVMIAPWYTAVSMPYWIGLAGLAFVYLWSFGQENNPQASQPIKFLSARRIYPSVVMLAVLGLYLFTNLTYRDKSFYLKSSSPVSASCVRNYAVAPTYCERSVFQWSVNRVYLADFGWLLQSHNLNIFSPHQLWTMQGDSILGNVYSPDISNKYQVEWSDGLPGKPAAFTDYHHLNVSVSSSQSVVWKVSLPDNLKSAQFISAVGVGESVQMPTQATFNIFIATQDNSEKLVYSQTITDHQKGWNNFKINILPYKGQEIKLRLAVNAQASSYLYLYKYPSIDIVESPEPNWVDKPLITPNNTELSPEIPLYQPSDYIFDLELADIHGLTPVDEIIQGWTMENDPYLSFNIDTPLDLSDFGWVSFTESVLTDMPSRAAEIFLSLEGQNQPIYAIIPLLPDDGMHTYTYPLHLLGITGKLTALRFLPVMMPSSAGDNIVTISDIRLIHLP